MEMKKVSISAKRQITIPKKFFTMLGFDTEAECMVRGNELVVRPVKTNTGGEFAEQILADLIDQGYSANELLFQNPNMNPMRMFSAGRRKNDRDTFSSSCCKIY